MSAGLQKRRSKREKATGRGEGRATFGQVPTAVGTSAAVRSLAPAIRWLLVVIAADYKGHNNGALTVTRKRAAEWGVCNDTLRRGLPLLEERGLIIRTDPGSRSPPKPARFAITWKSIDATDYTREASVPSGEWKEWAKGASENSFRGPWIGPVGSVDRTRDAA